MKAKLYIRGEKNLILIIRSNGKHREKKLATINLNYFDRQKMLPLPGHADYEDLLFDLGALKSKMHSLQFSKFNDVGLAMNYLLSAIGVENKVSSDKTYISFFQDLIAQMEKKGKKGNAEIYTTVLTQFLKYKKNVEFAEIDASFFIKYRQYLTDLDINLSVSTIKKYLSTHRAVYNKAVVLGVCEDAKPFVNLFKGLSVRARRHKNRYLDKEMLKKMRDFETTSVRDQRAIDLSLLQYYMCGADLVDVYYMKWNKISRGRYYFERRKLGEKGYEIDIKLFPEAMAIIEKYTENKNGEYIFPWGKGWAQYKTFRDNHLKALKSVQKKLKLELWPVNDNLTTKVIRHTFATMAKFAHYDPDLIKELMGHERNEIDTVYKDLFPQEERDAAQLKIITI